MTPQEVQLLNSLVERINQTQLQEKDPDAEALLNQTLGANPDALYILAQTVLVQNIALEQAKAQVTQLQQQVQQARQPAHATSFLGNLLGHRDPEPAPPAPPPYQPVNPQYAQPAPPQYPQPGYQAPPQYVPSSQPSFLQGAMQTAAGVAAGALAFEGVESVLHGLGGHSGYGFGAPGMGMGGFGMGGGGFDRPVEETVVNNYYDDPGAHGTEHGGEQHFQQSSDQQGDAHLTDASYNTTGDDRNDRDGGGDSGNSGDSSDYDNSGFDNSDSGSGFDDNGGFDDGGGFDGGSDQI